MEEINLGETEEDLETLKMLEKFVSMNPNATLNLDWVKFFMKIYKNRFFNFR